MNIAATFIAEDALWVEDDFLHGQMKWSNEGWIFFSAHISPVRISSKHELSIPAAQNWAGRVENEGMPLHAQCLEVGLVCPWSKSGPSVSVGIWITD